MLQAHSAPQSDAPYTLVPIAVLSRSCIPFSWLDSNSTLAQIRSGSLFVANIPVLERYGGPGVVLAARLLGDAGAGLYLIEWVKRGIYSLSKLGVWVGEGDLLVAEKDGPGSIPDQASVVVGDGGEWWASARIEDPDSGLRGSMEKRIDVSLVFGKNGVKNSPGHTSLERSSSSDVKLLTPLERSQGKGNAVASEDVDGPLDPLRSPLELLDALREQYLQALYVSKVSAAPGLLFNADMCQTSVAYFAKGPLARCRTAFQSSDRDDSNPADLIQFYRNAVLNAKKMDLKYRETLPATVRDIAITVSDDESAPRKKRKSRKKTLGKNGLYPEEGDFIRKWWRDRSGAEGKLLVETSPEAETKRHIGDLRLRETQLQILLILETIALELATAEEEKKCTESNGKAPEGAGKPKTKKSQDLNVLLELHLDRLCIWHAVSAEENTVPDSIKGSGNHLSGKKVESDAVRDFCTEVIIPFYASRLPDKCKLITRKFGVNGTSSPRAKQARSQKAPRAQPGSAVRREQPQKSRRTLQRVLTDEQSASQIRPSLPRSKTTPAYPDAKRESMVPLLPTLSSNVRGGIQKAKRVENREVDLNAAARQHETKLKKVQMLVEQKKELDAAIHALRKPNRELVAKDIAEDADKRVSGGSSRKQKHPVRNALGQGVQVMATPKGPRKKDMVGLPPLPKDFVRAAAEQQSSPTSGGDAGIVPGSADRPRSFPASGGRIPGSDANQGGKGAVQETPPRRPPQSSASAVLEQSPLGGSRSLFRVPNRPAPRSTDVAPTTPLSARRTSMPPSRPPAGQTKWSMVTETPPKNTNSGGAGSPETAAKRPMAESTVSATPEGSIYEQLGWDDEDELAL